MKSSLKATMRIRLIMGALCAIILLPGCTDWFKSVADCSSCNHSTGHASDGDVTSSCSPSEDPLVRQGETLATLDGEPVISTKSFDREFNQIMEDNPQLKAILPHVPGAKTELLNGLVNRVVIDEYVRRNNIDQTSDYQQELERVVCAQKQLLNAKYFSQLYDVKVTDAEAKAFYEENKDTRPEFLVSRGGVQAFGLTFKTEDEAKVFETKAKTLGFDLAAQEAGRTGDVRDFKLVNADSLGIDGAVKDAIAAVTTFPTVMMVQGKDASFWVVNAKNKEERTYRSFAEIKDGIKQYVEKTKSLEVIEKEINKLKKEYNVVINDEVFGQPAQAMPQMQMPEQEQMPEQQAQTA